MVFLVETRKLTKTFGALTACDAVDLKVASGEIHALLGENGAGKSTLVKMLFGSLQPDAGEIMWQGAPVIMASPSVAKRTGIGMVFQHFSLFDALSAAENIALAIDDDAAKLLRCHKCGAPRQAGVKYTKSSGLRRVTGTRSRTIYLLPAV